MPRKPIKQRALLKLSGFFGFVSNFLYYRANGYSLGSCWRMS